MARVESQFSRRAARPGDPVALLDRVQWTAATSAICYGVRLGIRTNEPQLLDSVSSYLPPAVAFGEFSDTGRVYSLVLDREEMRIGSRYAVFRDRSLVGRSRTPEGALRLLQTDAQLFVAETAPEHVFVHAGVVGWHRRAILLPGRSLAGKSTLVLELVRAGADYYSDEYAVIDATGMVHPYPRTLSLRDDMGGVAAVKQSAESLRRVENTPLPAGLVVVCEYRKDGQWRPERLSPGTGALALLANTVPARRIPDIVMATLRKVVGNASILASDRGEAAGVVDSILNFNEKLVDSR